ncbi:hypothetical protein RCL1_004225 [Eukaryota sp. TZLM3-RCL]
MSLETHKSLSSGNDERYPQYILSIHGHHGSCFHDHGLNPSPLYVYLIFFQQIYHSRPLVAPRPGYSWGSSDPASGPQSFRCVYPWTLDLLVGRFSYISSNIGSVVFFKKKSYLQVLPSFWILYLSRWMRYELWCVLLHRTTTSVERR